MDQATENKKPKKPSLATRRNVRQRAWELAQDAYRRYSESMGRALDGGELRAEDVDSWTPPEGGS
jgi:hypothetical protein